MKSRYKRRAPKIDFFADTSAVTGSVHILDVLGVIRGQAGKYQDTTNRDHEMHGC